MKRLVAPALVALVALQGDVLAQSTGTGGANPPAQRQEQAPSAAGARSGAPSQAAGAAGQHDMLQQHIAACLILGNHEEIALAQFGMQRAQNDQVKQFAQTMIEQHQQAISKLQQAAPQVASMNLKLSAAQSGENAAGRTAARSATPGAPANEATTTRSTTGATGSTTGGADATSTLSGATPADGNQRRAAAGQGQSQPMVDYMREVKERCLSLTTQELGRQQGAEFDKAFMGVQIGLHTGMLAQLQAAEGRVSSELQPVIQEGTEMTQHHLAQARSIMEQLDASQGEGAARAAQGQTDTQRQ